jgi:hypothetical protein
MPLTQVEPTDLALLDTELTPSATSSRISLHLEDVNGVDHGSLQEVPLQEVQVTAPENH